MLDINGVFARQIYLFKLIGTTIYAFLDFDAQSFYNRKICFPEINFFFSLHLYALEVVFKNY